MKRDRARILWALVLTGSMGVGIAGSAWASHRWGCWKYANASVNFYNGATGSYFNYFQEESLTDSNSWNNFTDLVLTQVGSSGTTDHMNCFSGSYGFNGWLGIAEIRRFSGCTVLEGRARLNRSYLDSGYSATNRKHVACQEVGHLFGLDHNRGSSTTCMNDTVLTAPQPNAHDQSLINSIY